MTEVWKSQGRKFCEICKCWFGDNKASIQHHEGGQRHKAAVNEKLRELGRSSQKKADERTALAATLAAMEHGALASMRRNNEAVAHGPALPERGLPVGPRFPPSGSQYLDPRQHKTAMEMATEMARRKAENEEKKKAVSAKSELWKDEDPSTSDEPILTRDLNEVLWVEAVAEDGRMYYYHMYNGATSWEIPGPFFTRVEYEKRLADLEKAALERHKQVTVWMLEARASAGQPMLGLPTDPSQLTIVSERGEEITVAPPIQVAKRKQRRDDAELEEVLKRYRNDSTEEEEVYGSEEKKPHFVPVICEGVQHFAPKAAFASMPEKRGMESLSIGTDEKKEMKKEETAEVVEESALLDIPLPSNSSSADPSDTLGSSRPEDLPEAASHGESAAGKRESGPGPLIKEEKSDEDTEALKNGIEQETEESIETVAEKAPVPTGPFGAWTKVKENKQEKACCPFTDKEKEAEEKARAWKKNQEKKVVPEPKIDFKEKVAPILTKKKNVGQVEFKKRSAPKSSRQRTEI